MKVALTSLCTELLLPSWNSICCRWWGIWYSTILKANVEWLLFRSLIINLGTSSKFMVSTHTLLPPEFLALLQQVKKCSRRFQLKSLVHWWADSSPIRLWTCLVGILLFTKAFFFFKGGLMAWTLFQCEVYIDFEHSGFHFLSSRNKGK